MRHSTLRQFVVLGVGTLCLTAFGVLAQEQSFFAGGAAVELTAAQANRGKAVYDDNCANCHGANLDDGQFGPPLRGSAFKTHWSSQSADALFSYIAARMPPSAPGGLNNRAYSDVEAYVLRANGVAAGNR
jgi:mono/diheme cytochrome c family protein